MNKNAQLSEIAFENSPRHAVNAHVSSKLKDEIAHLRVGVLSTTRQALWGDLVEAAAGHAAAVEAKVDNTGSTLPISIRTVASAPDLLRALPTAQEDYLVFSQRPGLIWDRQLLQRVAREIAAVEALNIPWFCLCAEGQDLEGKNYAAAFFNHEPTLLPDRGRKLIVQTAGTLYVVKTAALRALGPTTRITSDLVAFMNALILIAYGRGLATVFTSNLYPCLAEHRSLSYVDLDQQLASLNPSGFLAPMEVASLFPPGVSSKSLVAAWVQALASNLQTKHLFSFVVRTLFRRSHMLRRCLISIEYLRISLNVPVEIVIATDVEEAVVNTEVSQLREDFPNLTFVVACGNSAGQYPYSRVRNLVAGLKATTGTRVCIIDDDDYYAPQAVSSFAQACEFGTEELVVFGSQIVYEKWITASVKHHMTITGYGTRFDAKHWAGTLRGSNSIPLCGLIHPGWFVRQVVQEYVYDFDLSEDFAFHLRCFAHPKRPPIRVIDDICAYQSHRANDDNVSNTQDRTGWVAEVGNGLFQLLIEDGRTFDVISEAQEQTNRKVAALEADVIRANRAREDAVRSLAGLIEWRSSQSRSTPPSNPTHCLPAPSRRSATQLAKAVLKRALGRA